jgi:group I intron endonuclease
MAGYNIYALKNGDQYKYIGQTRFDIEKRFKEHINDKKISKKTSWIKSLKSKGIIPTIELIDTADTFEECNKLEIHYIKLFKSFGALLVNGTIGGASPMKEKRHSNEYKDRLREMYSGENNPFYGKKHTKETSEKIKSKLKGRKSWNNGKKLSEEFKQKLSEIRKKKISEGLIVVHNKGKSQIDFQKVFELNKLGFNQKEIAKKLNCDSSNISRILNNKYTNRRTGTSKVSAFNNHSS